MKNSQVGLKEKSEKDEKEVSEFASFEEETSSYYTDWNRIETCGMKNRHSEFLSSVVILFEGEKEET